MSLEPLVTGEFAPVHTGDRGLLGRLSVDLQLENDFLPGDLKAQISAFIEHYNHRRYHEGLDNVTPADAYFGRAKDILAERDRIKRQAPQPSNTAHTRA